MSTTRPATIPATTMPGGTAPVAASSSNSCQVSIPDYDVLRQQNISKINTYYNTLLDSYTKNYTDYATQSASSNINDRTYANTTLKPKVADYNTQVINISQALIDNVNQDTDLVSEQKNELQSKTQSIDTMIDNMKLLNDKDTEMTVLSNSRQDSLNSTQSGTSDMQFNTYIYIGINILLVLSIVGLIIYLVYSSYSVKSNNNSNKNNLYKNIVTNN